MTSGVTLKPSRNEFFGELGYIHNDISLNDFYRSKDSSVVLGTKILVYLAFLWNLPENKNKKPEDRIFISNTALLKKFVSDSIEDYRSIEYQKHIAGLQSALERYEKDPDCFFIREFQTTDGNWIPLYIKDASGKIVFNPETRGLTKRRIIINESRLKELLTALPDHIASIKVKARSRSKRLINTRPITLKDYLVNEFIKTKVNDVNNARNINHYLEDQLLKYGSFEINPTRGEEISVASTIIYERNPYYAAAYVKVNLKERPN